MSLANESISFFVEDIWFAEIPPNEMRDDLKLQCHFIKNG